MYLVIDKEYRVYQMPVLSARVRMYGRAGKVSILNLRTMQGMNRPDREEELGGDWVDIQPLPDGFDPDDGK